MKQLLITLLLPALMAMNSASATTVKLSREQGLPGALVTLILEIDAIPSDGELALELDLFYDPTKVQYVPGSWKNLELFRDENGSALDFAEVLEDANPTRSNAYFNLVAAYSRPPNGVELISLDFRVADDITGEIPINLELVNPTFNSQIDSLQNGAIGVSPIPVPPALLLFGMPLLYLLRRARRA